MTAVSMPGADTKHQVVSNKVLMMFGITGDTPGLKQACSYFKLTEENLRTGIKLWTFRMCKDIAKPGLKIIGSHLSSNLRKQRLAPENAVFKLFFGYLLMLLIKLKPNIHCTKKLQLEKYIYVNFLLIYKFPLTSFV